MMTLFFFVVDVTNQNGDLVARNQIVSFVVGAGKFGGPRTGTKIIPCQNKPNRSPDVSLTQKTSVDQAAIYRLLGRSYFINITIDSI